MNSNKDSGAEGAAKGVTGTLYQLGNLTGGISKTAGGLVGSAGKGLGDTINNTTGTKAAGDGLQSVTGGIEDAGNSAGKGAENAGQWKKS
ncbi:hypothetical protein LTR85_005083 [Meristemomyces frigidus]|nr:hypothetical protein LTR85_005083 [Meristemomyces frigidus]